MAESNAGGQPTDQELASTTSVTKGATSALGAAVVAIGGAILTFSSQLQALGPVLGSGVLALVAIALVSATYIVVADMRIRTQVKVTQISEQAGAAPKTEGSLSQWSATTAPMAVKISGDAARFGVLALRHDAQGRTFYLIGRRGQRPQWVDNDQIEDTFYGADPSQFQPALE